MAAANMAAAAPQQLPGASGAALSSFRASQNSRLPQWPHYLRTEADGTKDLGRLEVSELKSLSHVGRVRFHTREFVPPGDRTVKKRTRLQPEHEEQLLYVALYRDKIAEHQAAIEAQRGKEPSKGRSERRQRHHVAALDTSMDTMEFVSVPGERELLPEGVEASASASLHEASAADGHSALGSSAIGAAAGGPLRDSSLPPVSERSPQRGVRSGLGELSVDQEHKKATHIASVTSTPGAGGVASEYMESKRLGKLFDDWKRRQGDDTDDQGVNYSARTSSSRQQESNTGSSRAPRNAATGAGTDERGGNSLPSGVAVSQNTSKAKVSSGAVVVKPAASAKGRGRGSHEDAAAADSPASSSGSKAQGKRKHRSADVDAEVSTEKPPVLQHRSSMDRGLGDDDLGADSDYGSDMSEQRGVRISESKLVSRLFQVVTNPKVTGEAAGDIERRVPSRKDSYVEGFPTLNLMRLHRGPWRLDPVRRAPEPITHEGS